jgi:hypothetical protein
MRQQGVRIPEVAITINHRAEHLPQQPQRACTSRVASVFVRLYKQLRQYLYFCTSQPGFIDKSSSEFVGQWICSSTYPRTAFFVPV